MKLCKSCGERGWRTGNTYISGGLRLFPMNLLKQLLQPKFEVFLLVALVIFANKVSTGSQSIIAKRKGSHAEILRATNNQHIVQYDVDKLR